MRHYLKTWEDLETSVQLEACDRLQLEDWLYWVAVVAKFRMFKY